MKKLLLFLLFSAAARGATLVVTSAGDSGTGSLRQALANASDGDTIQFDAALSGGTISLTSAELVIDKDIVISGPGPSLLSVTGVSTMLEFRIFSVAPNHSVSIEGITINDGYIEGVGGGILNGEGATLTVKNCTVSHNYAGDSGGGISNFGMLLVVESTISGNLTGDTSAFPQGYGGGIDSGGLIAGTTLIVSNSTITENTANIQGGGIWCGGTITISNSTISHNWAGSIAGTGNGGGINNAGELTVSNSTFADNVALHVGESICVNSAGSLEIGNTILTGGTDILAGDTGTIVSRGYNLSSDNGGGWLTATGDQINANPMLGPLADNGGPTFTYAPLPGSPAINAGNPNFTPPPLDDQRGYDRIFNGRIDIGSLEVQPTPTPGPTPTPTPTSTPTATATPSATPTPTSTPIPTPSPTPTSSPTPARILNISTRLRVETGDNVMIGGFIITGNSPKSVALRGIGPSLTASGISDALADPTLELRDGSGALLFQNDDWQDNPVDAAQLAAWGLALQDQKESGIVATLQPSAYSVILTGKEGGTGVGLVEVYDPNSAANSRLANISTRGFVQAGDNVMIGGFILGGGDNTEVVVRGIGPSLAQAGLHNTLADPTLELRDNNGALLFSNDNWQDDPAQAEELSTHGLAPPDPTESAIFASLPPGVFTAILAGRDASSGIGLVEIYHMQ